MQSNNVRIGRLMQFNLNVNHKNNRLILRLNAVKRLVNNQHQIHNTMDLYLDAEWYINQNPKRYSNLGKAAGHRETVWMNYTQSNLTMQTELFNA